MRFTDNYVIGTDLSGLQLTLSTENGGGRPCVLQAAEQVDLPFAAIVHEEF